MYSPEFYAQLKRDIARELAAQLADDLAERFRMPVSLTVSEASRWTGISKAQLRTLYHAGIITGRQTGRGDNAPIVLHTQSLLRYLGIKEPQHYISEIIKTLAA